MTRDDMRRYAQRYNALATVALLPSRDDDETGYGPAIDDALRLLGVTEADLYPADDTAAIVDPAKDGDALALLRYTTLQLLLDQMATQVDISVGEPAVKKAYSQAFKQMQSRLDVARADIAERGYGPQDFVLGTLQLDIFEPITATGGAWGAPLGWY